MKRMRFFSAILALVLASTVFTASATPTSFGFTGDYEPQHWTATGPGTTSITPSSGATTSATFSYNLDPGFSGQWTFAVTAAQNGTASFDWNYSGFHSFYQVKVGLIVFATGPSGQITHTLVAAGPVNCCDAPSAGFNYNGTASIEVHAGYAFGIIASGSHFDGTEVVRGAIGLTNFEVGDTTPPTITPNVSGTLGNNGWHTSDVAVSWSVSDLESAISSQTGCGPESVSADTTGITFTCEATSEGGTGSQSVTIKRDATDPADIVVVGSIADGGSYVFGSVPAAPTCNATDATSGLDGCAVTGYSTAVGSHSLTATATDNAGNPATSEIAYTVIPWTLTGFYQPVDMGGVINTVKGGSTVPLKFEVFNGSVELTDPAIVTMSAKPITCATGAPTDAIEEIVATGGTGLRYDTTSGQFIYNWKTPKKAGTCYAVTATTSDGSFVTALFKLK